MSGFFKFLLVLILGAAGLAGAWYGFTDRALDLPDTSRLTELETWQPFAVHGIGLGAGLLVGLILVSLLPRPGKRSRKPTATDRLATAMMEALAGPPGRTGYVILRTQKGAAGRIAAQLPAAARLIAEGNLSAGFGMIEKAARKSGKKGISLWSDLGFLAVSTQPERALAAFRETAEHNATDFWTLLIWSRLERSVSGDKVAAKTVLESAFQIARTRREQAYALNDRGQMLILSDQAEAADSAFRQSADIARQLHKANPEDGEATWQLAVTLKQMARAAKKAGTLEEARILLQEVVTLYRGLLTSDLREADAQTMLSLALQDYAAICARTGDMTAAQAAYAECLELRRAMLAAAPERRVLKREIAVICRALGDITSNPGYWQEALEWLEAYAADAQLSPADKKLLEHLRSRIAA